MASYILKVNDVDGDLHKVKSTDVGDILNWIAKFVYELDDAGLAGINIQVINEEDPRNDAAEDAPDEG